MIAYAKFKVGPDGILERKLYYLNDEMLQGSISLAHETICREYGWAIDDVKLFELVKES